MSKKYLDKKRYLVFTGGNTPTIEMWNSHEGEKIKDGKNAGKPRPEECLGYFSSILAALKYYVNVLTCRGKDMSIQEYIDKLSVMYEKFNDVSWLELAKETE